MGKTKRFFGMMLMAMMVMGFFGSVSSVSAAISDSCNCYCAIEGVGATQYPNATTRVKKTECYQTCADVGLTVAACADTTDQKPQYNVTCFTPAQCTSQKGIQTPNGKGTPKQPGECVKGMFYCYPNPENAAAVKLQVSIGGYKVANDLGEYVSKMYKWLLGAGTTIAIVFLMIGGLRWSIGGVNAEQIGKAKKTILSAVTGLVLLMSTYLILYTVNPYLLRLQVPAFPMIKTVALVGEESCGYLEGQWGDGDTGGHYPYLIENGAPYDSPYALGEPAPKGGQSYELENRTNGESCGSVADVTKDWEGNKTASDMSCTYDYCPEKGDRCFPISGGKGYCLSCSDFAPGESPEIPASQSVCGQLSDPLNGRGCVYISLKTYSSELAGFALEFFGSSGDPAEILKDPACFSCESKKCSTIPSQELCELDPCSLGCEWAVETVTHDYGAATIEGCKRNR